MLKKTTRLTLVDQVILQIEALIESGKWPVGKKIPAEPELVADLNVSRNTLREGIKALCHAGVLYTKQGDGTYVCSSSTLGVAIQRRVQRSSLLDTLEVRHALELEAARLSAERRTEADIERFRYYQERCNYYAETHDIEQFVASDVQLHQAIVKSSGNRMLFDLYAHITGALQESNTAFLTKSFANHLPRDHHQDLIEAIVAQNPEEAGKAVQLLIDGLKSSVDELWPQHEEKKV
ncbi:FadR family transcriptional regulator [Paenibacillus oenotherae]|uniref:FadR family transcriptional regulator n=1 Tax=Paenibacillus oenotherae TaxID=1435645 RepID=A0ABS7D5R7_9BACL|nr:FadR/GntR family transcriptional regulator [Paenibacillus oenotherae]MBW7475201.1 FadR family transcriptional regulator [Paenibacillus oenotherae]